jgi:carbonic anhydrase/acetyltransferase-like protein (isoleucine patch superfamily)
MHGGCVISKSLIIGGSVILNESEIGLKLSCDDMKEKLGKKL